MEEIKKVKNIVIGAGPAGRLGSFELGKLGEETLLIEKNTLQEPVLMKDAWLYVHLLTLAVS